MRDLEISKELLIEVLGSEYNQRLVDWFQIEDDNFLRTYYDCWAKGFFENTEIEAIIKSCEFILIKKESK